MNTKIIHKAGVKLKFDLSGIYLTLVTLANKFRNPSLNKQTINLTIRITTVIVWIPSSDPSWGDLIWGAGNPRHPLHLLVKLLSFNLEQF